MQSTSDAAWHDLREEVSRRARATYSVCSAEDFQRCRTEHLSYVNELDMMQASAYHCPVCGRLLKDRGTPVAAAVIQERTRLRELFDEAESAPGHEGPHRWARFRRALGL